MAKSVAGRITLNLVAEIIVTLVTVSLAIFWMAHRQNDQAEDASKTMVLGGISSMEDHVKQFANDYAWWEAGYDAYVKGDKEWVDENYGSGITDTQISDVLVIISPDGKMPYSWAIDNDHGTPDQIFSPHIRDRIKALLDGVPVENEQARSGYFRIGDDILLVAVARMAPVSHASEVDPKILPFLVQGIYLSKQRLTELGSQFLLDDVHLQVGSPTGDELDGTFPLIKDLDGKNIGAFVWTPLNPGYTALKNVGGPVTAALALFCVVAFGAAYRTRRLAVKLTDSEKEAVIAARTDSMTGLMNRAGFNEMLESGPYERACQIGELAVIYFDVNGFKTVNDSIGHHGGDELVKQLSKRVSEVLVDEADLARIGGDEFVVALLSGRPSAVEDVARRIAHSIDKPFMVSGFEFRVTVAVGYAISNEIGMESTEVVRRADVAMFHAKKGAERDPVAYESSMETGALEKKQIESGLRRAIVNGELQVYYQPVVRAADGGMVGVEALMRWTSPEFGVVSPAVFIPVAEETGLIPDIGRFVVGRACEDLHRWPGLRMAINVSPVQLRDPGFADEVRTIVEQHGHDPQRFDLELTEGILVNNPTIAERKLAMLNGSGFRLSLDDFGTGFSSIGYLRQFPFNTLKLDRAFVRDIGQKANAGALIQSLIALADALDLEVVAEGVENEEQLALLRLTRCNYIQGFLFSRPVTANDIDVLLAREQQPTAGPTPTDRRVAARA